MSHIFISYSKQNKPYARQLADHLLDQGFDVWIDDRIDYGDHWLRAIIQAVRDCAACVVIMTPQSAASKWVQLEVTWAQDRFGKPVFPVLRDGGNWPIFDLTQYVDCRDGSLPDAGFVQRLAEHAPLRDDPGADVTEAPQDGTPRHDELDAAPPPPADEIDINAAIAEFYRLRGDGEIRAAWDTLVAIDGSGEAPAWFDLDGLAAELGAAIQQQERAQAAEREYAVLRVVAQYEPPDRVRAALQAFWELYGFHDPDGIGPTVGAYLVTPEQRELLDVMLDPNVPPPQRAEAGRTLAELGDPRPGVGLRDDGLPDIDWVEIPAGEFIFGDESEGNGPQTLTLPTFHIARYPVTYRQFQAFIDADDGFHNPEWWRGLAASNKHKRRPDKQWFQYWNHPRENVSWYDAVAFCRWLSSRLGYEITLPTEQQFEKAARGTDGRAYPWGEDYVSGCANVDETEDDFGPYYLQQTSAVGIYPQGASPYGVLDMAGNVWCWCLNEYDDPENTGLGGDAWRVLRGGSGSLDRHYARSVFRHYGRSVDRGLNYGFWCVCASPMT